MNHHPQLAESGELELAQRAAVFEALQAIADVDGEDIDAAAIRLAIDAYLAAMRRQWTPGPIRIGEGDFVRLDVVGAPLEVHAGVVRESDVVRDPTVRTREWSTAKLVGEGHFVDGELEPHDVDGLTIYLGPHR